MKPAEASAPEHVFPEAIGGSLTIRCVCNACNHWLGSNVDAPLADHWAIQIRRRNLNLRGKGGKLPNPRMMASVDDHAGVNVILDYGRDGSLIARTQNPVVSDKLGNKTVYALDAELKQFPHIVETIRARTHRSVVAEPVVPTLIQTFPSPTLRGVIPIDIHDYRRALIKIAYELAHRWLGDTYLMDPTATVMRNILMQTDFDPEAFSKSSLAAQIYLSGPLAPESGLDTASAHFAGLFSVHGALAMCVQIFDLFRAEIIISHEATRYPESVDRAILLDAVSLTHIEDSADRVLRQLLLRSRTHGGG